MQLSGVLSLHTEQRDHGYDGSVKHQPLCQDCTTSQIPIYFHPKKHCIDDSNHLDFSDIEQLFPLTGYGKYGLNNKEDCVLCRSPQVAPSVIQIQITVGGACVIISAVIIITCYVTIFYTIRTHYRRARSAQRDTTTVQSNFNVATRRESRGEEIQIAITLFLFVVIFGICWSPTVVSVIINTVTGRPTSHLAGLIRVNALILETVLDPIVYAIRNRKFRMVFKKTFKRHARQSQN